MGVKQELQSFFHLTQWSYALIALTATNLRHLILERGVGGNSVSLHRLKDNRIIQLENDLHESQQAILRMAPDTMTITDTQVLSYYYKGATPPPASPITISSITAAEFLLIQSPKPNSANYYPILPTILKNPSVGLIPRDLLNQRALFDSKKHAALGKHRTDQLVLNFNGMIPSFIEFGSIAISQIINNGHEDVYAASISHLEKDHQKKLRRKLGFLVDANVQCLAVTPNIANVGLNILSSFLDKYEEKQNPRNTINDILILSTAIEHSVPLLTEDSLLRRFTAEILGAQCVVQQPSGLLIDFTTPEVVDRRKPFESKGYINRGWQIMERRGSR